MVLFDDKNCWERIRSTELFLLDLDGTVYLENELIPGVKEFTTHLNRLQVPYLFITNNSSCSHDEYLRKLRRLGIEVSESSILTSGQATGEYLNKKTPGANLFVVGTEALKAELKEHGHIIYDRYDSAIDYVIVGYDTELTYDKIRTACRLIECGVGFIATNPDLVCPGKKNRYLPDCGSICKMLENATGKKPIVIGKPNTVMIEIIKYRYKLKLEKMAIIGDRLYTDIALGKNAGIFSICVLTGESTVVDIENSQWKPDQIISSIDFLNGALKDHSRCTEDTSLLQNR